MKLVNTNCYNCESYHFTYYDSENGFDLVKCKECGLLYVNPRPSESDISEASKTGIHKGEIEFNVTNPYNEQILPRYNIILNDFYNKDELIGKEWLDIGCGNGEFLMALNHFTDSKINLLGSEPNCTKIQNIKQHKLDVKFLNPNRLQGQFDFISLLNVYSHLANPVESINNWKRHLRKNGELLIETGHSCHLPRKFHSKPYFLPDHLSFANKGILIKLMEKLEFQILKVKIYRSPTYPESTLYNFAKEMVKFSIGKRNSFHSFIPGLQHGDMFIRAKKLE